MIRPLLIFSLLAGLFSGCQKSDPVPSASASPEKWQLVWHDEFDGEGIPDPTKWTYAVGGHGWGNKEKQFYTEAREETPAFETANYMSPAARKSGRKTTTPPPASFLGDWVTSNTGVLKSGPRFRRLGARGPRFG